MTAPSETTAADLDALLVLQDLDTAIDRHRHRRTQLPERAQLAEIDGEVTRLGPELEEVTAARDELAGRESAVEAELAATEDRAAVVSRRLYGGEVSASRELQAMATDVEGLKARASVLEDQALEILAESEPVDGRLAELSERAASLTARRQLVTTALQEAESVVDGEVAELQEQRSGAAAAVPQELLATYERLRAQMGGVGAARLVGSRCDGCHLTLPATELDRIRHLPAGELITCDQCGRILIRG